MRLSDIMGAIDLTIFPQIALIIFLVVFASVLGRVFGRGRKSQFQHAASLPLDDGPISNRSIP